MPKSLVISWRQVLITALIFILGVVIGHKGFERNWFPFLRNTDGAPIHYQIVNAQQPGEYKDVDFQQFWEVWSILERDYLETENINQEKMVQGAIGGMTGALGDPYTVYLPPERDQRAEEELAGAFFGVGIELGYIDDTLAVVAPLKGMPAEQAGIQAGDYILHVKDEAKGLDEDTTGWSLSEAVDNIRGQKDTPVQLTLFRKGDNAQPFDVTLIRGEIVIPSVELSFVEHNGQKAAHIELSRFGERTKEEWGKIVNQILADREVDVVLLDMRNNPGGFFDMAIEVASDFIENGVVVSQQGKFSTQDFRAKGTARLADVPVKVLVNRGSASASEIVAGALRDQLQAPLIGEKTFGKGTVQDRRELEDGGGLHVTIARWLLPGGSSINHEGIPVDVEVTDNPDTEEDEVVLKALES
ncbi:MAG TPA: S41 family peptidase [Patescibacteria group bacterium]